MAPDAVVFAVHVGFAGQSAYDTDEYTSRSNLLFIRNDFRVVERVVSLARSFDLRTVAEGAVNDEMINVLWTLGCDVAQGYFYL